jgi:3-oxoacyl-[acyl-carrier protein] reductase
MTSSDEADTIRGRVALVTGAGRGLAAGVARALARAGARVVVNYRSDARAAEGLVREIHDAGGEARALRADVSEWDSARGLVETTLATYGSIDVLVNGVGAFMWHPVAEIEPHEWRRLVSSNLDTVFHMCRLTIPHMRKRHFGRIVSLGAVGAERTLAHPRVAAYSAAKAAVVAFSKALALEEARHGITVNVVAPGVMEDHKSPGEPNDHVAERVPAGRAGHPDELARAVLFLASPASGFVTGQTLAVAGGWHL